MSYYEDNKEQWKAYGKTYRAANRERLKADRRAAHLKALYGITSERYEEMLTAQDGKCAICGNEPAKGKRLHVNHNHATGAVRKLLCMRCNTLVGYVESPLRVFAEAYIEAHR